MLNAKRVEKFIEFLEGYDAWGGSIRNTARGLNMHHASADRWLAYSRKDGAERRTDSPFIFEFRSETMFLHEHLARIQSQFTTDIIHNAMIRARDGTTDYARFQGRKVPEVDYDMMDDLRSLGLPCAPEDCIKRDVDGNVMFEMIMVAPSNEIFGIIAGAFDARFTKKSEVAVTVKGGVMHVGQPAQAALPKPPLPEIEVIEPEPDPVEARGPVTVPFEDILGPDLAAAAPADEPPTYDRPVLSPLQLDLIQKARERGAIK
jgi:hypothetical protein